MLKLGPLLIGLLTLVCVAEGVVILRLDARLARLEATAVSPETARRTQSTGTSARGLPDAVEDVVDAIEDRVVTLERGQEGLRAHLPALEGAEGAARGPVLSPSARVALEEQVAAMVDRKVAERMGDETSAKEVFGDEKKPSVSELSEAVGMTEVQEDETVRILNDGKTRSFELLSLPRADGGSMAGDLVTALRDAQDPKQELGAWIQKLMKEQVPGRSENYMSAIMKIQQATWSDLDGALDVEQVKKLKRMGLDILEVKTGFEPFEELFSDQ